MKVEEIIIVRIFTIGLLLVGCILSAILAVVVSESMAIKTLLFILVFSMVLLTLIPLSAGPCPHCKKSFFGGFFSYDPLTSFCKKCGEHI